MFYFCFCVTKAGKHPAWMDMDGFPSRFPSTSPTGIQPTKWPQNRGSLKWTDFLYPLRESQWYRAQKTRPRLARKQNIASEVGPTLQDAFFFPTLREASARQHQARCSAQTGRCKLVCASCSTQVALCKLLCASCSAQVAPSWSLQVAPCKFLCANCAPCKLLCASCSVQVALCKLLCVSCSAQVALGKALCANWSVQVGLRKLLCATCSAQVALRKLL